MRVALAASILEAGSAAGVAWFDRVEDMAAEMKVILGIVVGVLAAGLVLTAAAVAFVWPANTSVEVLPMEEFGVSDVNAHPSLDRLAIEITWAVADPDSTYVLQRVSEPGSDDWSDIFTLVPGSDAYADDGTAAYTDTDVEHLVTYYYRFYITDPDGGMGYSEHVEVTAVKP